ncbi:MAG: glycosyltransferase family 2 protein [Coraliomargaritaceae bacterium]
MNLKISIITVCLNEAVALASTCESIRKQRYPNLEWIVIDGASTDSSLDVLRDYKDCISNLISEPDEGIYDAMNKGIGLSSGDYLLFLNAGDKLAGPDVLYSVKPFSNIGIIYGDIEVVSGRVSKVLKSPQKLSKDFLMKKMMPHQSSFIKKSLFEKYGCYDQTYRIAADYDFFARILHLNRVKSKHCGALISVFCTGGVSNDPKWRWLRKVENHQIRKRYFWKYFFTWRCLRTECKLLFRGRIIGK